jgi:hypothetical protein
VLTKKNGANQDFEEINQRHSSYKLFRTKSEAHPKFSQNYNLLRGDKRYIISKQQMELSKKIFVQNTNKIISVK